MQPTTAVDASPRVLAALFAILQRLRRAPVVGGLDRAALLVLHRVDLASDGRLSDLAGDLGLDASTVSRHVGALAAAGYVDRSEDPGDRRACRLAVTPAGREVLARAMAARAGVVREALASWSTTDQDTLVALLDRLAVDLSPEGGPGGRR